MPYVLSTCLLSNASLVCLLWDVVPRGQWILSWLSLCLVLSVSVKRLVEKAECFALVKRLAVKIGSKITCNVSGGIIPK